MTEEDKDTQAMTARLPVPLYKQLRRVSFETGTPMNKIIVAALIAAISREQGTL